MLTELQQHDKQQQAQFVASRLEGRGQGSMLTVDSASAQGGTAHAKKGPYTSGWLVGFRV